MSWEETKRTEKNYKLARKKDGKVQAIILKAVETDGAISGIVLELENQGQKQTMELTIEEFKVYKKFLAEFENQTFSIEEVIVLEKLEVEEKEPPSTEENSNSGAVQVEEPPSGEPTASSAGEPPKLVPLPPPPIFKPPAELVKLEGSLPFVPQEAPSEVDSIEETSEDESAAEPPEDVPANEGASFDPGSLGIPEAIPIIEQHPEEPSELSTTPEPPVPVPPRVEEVQVSHDLAERMTESLQAKMMEKEEIKQNLIASKELLEAQENQEEVNIVAVLKDEPIATVIEAEEPEVEEKVEKDIADLEEDIDFEKEKEDIGDIKELFGNESSYIKEAIGLLSVDEELEQVEIVEKKFEKIKEIIEDEEIVAETETTVLSDAMASVVDILPEGPARNFVKKMMDKEEDPSAQEIVEIIEDVLEDKEPELDLDFLEAMQQKDQGEIQSDENKQKEKEKLKFW